RLATGGNNGLCPVASEASGHPVHLKRRTRPGTIKHGITGFAGEDLRSNFCFAVMLFVEWEALPGLQLRSGWGLHLGIETGDQDAAFRILQLGNNLDQSKKRIGRGASVHAGMQICFGADGLNLGINQATWSDAQSWK